MKIKYIGKRIKIIRGPQSLRFGPRIFRSGSFLVIGTNKLRVSIRVRPLPDPDNILFIDHR